MKAMTDTMTTDRREPVSLEAAAVIRRDNLCAMFETFVRGTQELWPGTPERGMVRTFAAQLKFPESYVANMRRGPKS